MQQDEYKDAVKHKVQSIMHAYAKETGRSLEYCLEDLRGFLMISHNKMMRKYYGKNGGEWSAAEIILITLFTGHHCAVDYLCQASGHVNVSHDQIEAIDHSSQDRLCKLTLQTCAAAGELATTVASFTSSDDANQEVKLQIRESLQQLMSAALATLNHPEIVS